MKMQHDQQTIQYLLTPDSSASLRLRRMIAEQGGRRGVIVGTFVELQELLRAVWGLQPASSDWDERLPMSAAEITNAFWSASLAQAGQETCLAVASSLTRLLEAAGPGGVFTVPQGAVSERVYQRLADLDRLHAAMGRSLPPQLHVIAQLLAAEPAVFRPVTVHYIPDFPPLNPWQASLLEKLARAAVSPPDDHLLKLLNTLQSSTPAAPEDTPLRLIQEGIFAPFDAASSPDGSLQFCAVRDPLHEAEVAAGMIQTMLDRDQQLTPDRIAVLLPDDPLYQRAVADAFGYAGIPRSGLAITSESRNLGREAVHGLLRCLNRPAPVMALADLLSSPLMPWGAASGMSFAQSVMDGNFSLEAPDRADSATRKMLGLLRSSPHTTVELREVLGTFRKLLSRDDTLQAHRTRAEELIDELAALAGGPQDIPWPELLRHAAPQTLKSTAHLGHWREGVAVFRETEEPWRQVDHLLVLGFSDGHYPLAETGDSVFTEQELVSIRQAIGLACATVSDTTARRRCLLQRQLAVAAQSVTVLLPRRTYLGEAVAPSATLDFIAGRLGLDTDELILELETSQGMREARNLAVAPAASAIPPRPITSSDLSLGLDLIARNRKTDGSQRPESPSSLETMMVSPLAWLLDRLHLQPKDWAPEELDIMAKGTLAHDVLEHLLPPGQPLPDPAEALPRLRDLLLDAISRIMPFLMGREWKVEREHLAAEIETAAAAWLNFLHEVQAQVLGCEVNLEGMLGDLPVRGSTDLLLELPGNRLYVVDYKKQASRTRRERMDRGYDHQASLYRTMLQTGGPTGDHADDVRQHLATDIDISVLYFMLNDQVVLADSSNWLGRHLAGCYELSGDISGNALALIRERISQLRQGRVMLNSSSDEKEFPKQTGIKPYALDNSPLVRLFMKQDAEGAEEGDEA
jgi:RecB family exonuclease